MFARSDSPQLRLIHRLSPTLKMKVGRVSEASYVGKFEQENQAKFEQLERDRDQMSQVGIAGGVAGIAVFTAFSPAALIWFPALWKLAETLATISHRYFLMPELMEAFEDEDVAIEVGLKPEDASEIDFFLRFPDKEFVLIHIRSVGTNSRVNFSLTKQVLQSRRRKGGLKNLNPNPITELLKQERWIRNHRTELLGTSSRDKRRQMAKVIVFWDEPKITDHPEQLYATINDQKYLYVTTETSGSAFVIQKAQVVDFIRDYLASKRSRKPS